MKSASGEHHIPIIWVLGRIGDTRSVVPLLKVLDEEEVLVRGAATQALGEIGNSEALEYLVVSLRDESSLVRGIAAEALSKHGWQVKSKTEEAYYLIAQQSWLDVAKLGEAAIDPLLSTLGDENGIAREKAAEALGRIGKSTIKPLVMVLRAKNNPVRQRWWAAEALGMVGSNQALKPLIRVLQDSDEDMYVRYGATRALGDCCKTGGFGKFCSQRWVRVGKKAEKWSILPRFSPRLLISTALNLFFRLNGHFYRF